MSARFRATGVLNLLCAVALVAGVIPFSAPPR